MEPDPRACFWNISEVPLSRALLPPVEGSLFADTSSSLIAFRAWRLVLQSFCSSTGGLNGAQRTIIKQTDT